MIQFYNLKINDFSYFYPNETEPTIDDLLENSFKDLNAMISYIEINKNSNIYKNIPEIFSEEHKIIILLLNSSINSYGKEVFSILDFKHDLKNTIKEMFLGFETNEIFYSITKKLYELIEEDLKNNKYSIYNFLQTSL